MSLERYVGQIKTKLLSEGIDLTNAEEEMIRQGKQLLKDHGPNPATKAQAAANAAAIMVTAAASGVNYSPVVQIIQIPETNQWRAEVVITVCTAADLDNGSATPGEVAKAACMYAAGNAGEAFTDHGHPLSQLYSRAKAAFFASKIDLVSGGEEIALATYWPRVTNLTQEILAYNEEPFATLFQALLDQECVAAPELQNILAMVKPVNINQISGRVH